ncbi:MAG: creatininase family protein [Duodenibacillus sp.]|nr:creatininase family protein [Duodenibacillus sp.]
MYLAEMCWQQAAEVLADPATVVVIPVGSTEQHGCVGPLGTDFLIPDEFCRRLSGEPGLLIVPTVNYGVATHHINFPGTIDIGLEVMTGLMRQIFQSLFRHGARRFVVINGHGGNDPAIEKAALEIYRQGGVVSLVDWWGIAPKLNPEWPTGHGDAQETAAVMAFRPELIQERYLVDNVVPAPAPGLKPVHINTVLFEGAPVKVIREIRDTVNTGGLGGLESRLATPEWGRAMMDGMTAWIRRFIGEFRNVALPDGRWKN